MPRIILALSDASQPKDAIVLDHRDRTIWFEGRGVRIGRVIFRIVAAALSAPNGKVPKETLVEAIWGDDPSGGPLHAQNYIATILNPNRTFKVGHRRLSLQEWLGFSLRSDWNGSYILTWHERAKVAA